MITIAEFKQHARIVDDPADAAIQAAIDADIQQKIDAAALQAEELTARTFVSRNLEARFKAWATYFVLPKPPVSAIVSVMYLNDEDAEQSVGMAEYRLLNRGDDSLIVFDNDMEFPALSSEYGDIKVTYTAGYETIPAPVKAWVLMRAAALYETRESDNDRPAVEVSFVDELLRPYKVLTL